MSSIPPSTPPGATPAGWYPDTNQPGTLRYWDGAAWTQHTHRSNAPSPAVPATPTAAAAAPVPSGYQVYQPGMIAGSATTIGPDGQLWFAGRPVCTPWQRLGAWALDALLMLVTLVIGWLIWACFTAQEGQTPARKILHQRVLRYPEATVASFGWMLGMRGIVAGIVMNIAWQCIIPGLVLAFMPFWDDKNQTVTDKISTSVVVSEA
ncbi:MAG: DUF2510 domain-containing protein [Acidimicrobiales bacterium]|nr:DUF2510 domain-containing protein [Acidimicrobiales bacterium]